MAQATATVTLSDTPTSPRSFRREGSKHVFLRGQKQDLPVAEAKLYQGNPLFSVEMPASAEPAPGKAK